MLGIFGTLNMATRSLSAQRVGTEVAGHNLANVNNEGYARQRVTIESTLPVPTELGPQGTGADAFSIKQLRDVQVDRQILRETSVTDYWEATQKSLQYIQASLGQEIDRQASGPEGAAATGSVGGQHGLSEGLSDLFNAFQSLSTDPTSQTERGNVYIKAQNLAVQFNQVDARLESVNQNLNDSINTEVSDVNRLLGDIAKLNQQIVACENGVGGSANDLRDIRQQRIEELAGHVNLTTVEQTSGVVDIVIDGVAMTSGALVTDQVEAYDPGDGQLLLRAQTAGSTLNLTGGTLQGTIETRDGALTSLRERVNNLASELITQVNALHAGGTDLYGNTGEAFFTGTDAASIRVNSLFDISTGDPGRIQAAGSGAERGDNRTALALAQLRDTTLAALGGQTLNGFYGQTVAVIGQSLASTNAQLNNQEIVQQMLLRQRDSVSGVSIDEEMTDLIKYQRAFEASARLVSTLDEMLTTLVNLGR